MAIEENIYKILNYMNTWKVYNSGMYISGECAAASVVLQAQCTNE